MTALATPPQPHDQAGRRSSPSASAAAPGRLPLVGHVPKFMLDPTGFLRSLQPLGDVVRIRLAGMPVYVINSPDLLNQVLVADADKFTRGRLFDKGRPLVGDGLLTSTGELHARQRRLILPAFHRNQLREYADTMRAESLALTDPWRPGQTVAVHDDTYRLAARIVAKTLLGHGVTEQAIDEVRRWLPVFLRGLMRLSRSPLKSAEKLPTRANRQFAQARRSLHGLIAEYIESATGGGRADGGDLLSILANARDPETGEGMSARQLHDEVLTILLVGTETTGIATAWLLHELGAHPDVDARIHQEITRVLAGRPATFDDLPDLEYTGRVVKEILRLHNPIWFVMRRALVDVDLDGIVIPRDAEILYSPAMMHRDGSLWREPMRFDPDRWLRPTPRNAYIPFGVGDRKCVGDYFAMTEMTIAAASILPRWRLTPAPGRTVRESARTSSLQADAVYMVAHRR